MKAKTARCIIQVLLPAALLFTACASGTSAAENSANTPSASASENAENADQSDASQTAEQSDASQTMEQPDVSQSSDPSGEAGIEIQADTETNTASEASTTAPASVPANDYPDPYAMETYDSIPDDLMGWAEDVEYGSVEADVEYYSEQAGDVKYCNVMLPAGYDGSQEYPVLYMVHGWGGMYDSHIHVGSILHKLYGNMLSEGLTKPMIIVGVDMYTDPLADKDSKSDEEMRHSYDKAVDDIALTLMPFIEEHYSVKKGRTNTAITGVSEGATICLATGFKWQSKIAYIGSFAPCPGVIPTPYAKGTGRSSTTSRSNRQRQCPATSISRSDQRIPGAWMSPPTTAGSWTKKESPTRTTWLKDMTTTTTCGHWATTTSCRRSFWTER